MSTDQHPAPSATPTAATDAAWDLTLDELEAAVLAAESLALGAGDGAGPAQGWAPPAGLGPLPASREPRARALAARQQTALEALAEARDRSVRQLAALEQMGSTAVRSAEPAYLDRSF